MFKEKVYSIVKKIPKGYVTTYHDVAHALNCKAYQAVGNALNKNHSKNVPCHRVINSNGFVGKYNKGINTKIKILKDEGIKIGKNKRINLKKYLFRFR